MRWQISRQEGGMGGAVNDPIYLHAVKIWQLGYRGGVDDGICIMCNLLDVPADKRDAIREYYRQLHNTNEG